MDKSSQQAHKSLDRQPQRRLKDSCDMCSASKVRCDKQKPLCGRCEKLDYPCFYSPARRVGRPQGKNGNPSNVNDTTTTTTNSKPRPPRRRRSSAAITSAIVTIAPTASSPDIDPKFETAPSLPPQRQANLPPKRLNNNNHSSKGNHRNPDHQPAHATPFQFLPHPKPHHLPGSGLPTPPFARSRQQSRSSEDHHHHHHHPGIIQPASPSSSRACEQPGTDCVSLIMAVQSQLESASTSASHNGFSSAMRTEPERTNSKTIILQVASAAMRKLSTILICPCSGRLETGVLISAACLSILDLYGSVVRRSVTGAMSGLDGECLIAAADRHGVLGGGVAGGGSCLKSADGNDNTGGCGCHRHQNNTGNETVNRNCNDNGRDENEDIMAYSPTAKSPLLFGPQGSSSSSVGGENVNLTLVHVLDELAKFAAVVYQFTKRYETGTGPGSGSGSSMLSKQKLGTMSGLGPSGCSSESETHILQGLAALLKKRLKAVGDDTAAQLQGDPLCRGTVHAGQVV